MVTSVVTPFTKALKRDNIMISVLEKKLVILGGTFDPIHNGHISIILDTIKILRADKGIIAPVNVPPHKSLLSNSASPEDRIEMCRLAVSDYSNIEVSDAEIKREGISYTVDTLKFFKEKYKNYNLYFLIGEDMAKTFKTWKEPEEICRLCKLCIFPRNGDKRGEIKKYKNQISSIGGSTEIINADLINISSTMIRERLFQNYGVYNLIPNKVLNYIKEKKLYIKL